MRDDKKRMRIGKISKEEVSVQTKSGGGSQDVAARLIDIESAQLPCSKQGCQHAFGFTSLPGAGSSADLAAHHRSSQASFCCIVVRSYSRIGHKHEHLRQESLHPPTQD